MVASSAVKKEDRRIRITYALCFVALAVYALLVCGRLMNFIKLAGMTGYLEGAALDYTLELSNSIFVFAMYFSIMLFYVWICVFHKNRSKLIPFSFLCFAILRFAFYFVTFILYGFLFSSKSSDPSLVFVLDIPRMLTSLCLMAFGLAFCKHKKSTPSNVYKILFLVFILLYTIEMISLLIGLSSIRDFDFRTILTILEPFVLYLPAYIAYKALTDREFYQRFVVHYPTDVLHPKYSSIYKDD